MQRLPIHLLLLTKMPKVRSFSTPIELSSTSSRVSSYFYQIGTTPSSFYSHSERYLYHDQRDGDFFEFQVEYDLGKRLTQDATAANLHPAFLNEPNSSSFSLKFDFTTLPPEFSCVLVDQDAINGRPGKPLGPIMTVMCTIGPANDGGDEEFRGIMVGHFGRQALNTMRRKSTECEEGARLIHFYGVHGDAR